MATSPHHGDISKTESERISLAIRTALDDYLPLPALDRWRLYERICTAVGCVPLGQYPPAAIAIPQSYVLWPEDLQQAWTRWARAHYGQPGFNAPLDLNFTHPKRGK